MNARALSLVALTVVATILGTRTPAAAQGCILLRQSAPLFGTTGAVDQEVGTWTLTLTGRSSTANKHWNGEVRQIHREIEQSYVVNRQNSFTATIGYQLTSRVSLFAGVPFVEASWGIPSPRTGGPAARANENARGLGDITTLARVALFDPRTSTRSWNLLIGGGVKMPTGNNRATDVFPDRDGNNNVERFVDISVHPGDGGWGLIMDLQGYKAMGRFTAFGSGTWLANPKDISDVPTRGTALAEAAGVTNFNTVSDQFVFRAGTQIALTPHIAASIAWRMEGVPRYDFLGASHGRRRPGVEMYWEPGVTFNSGRHTVSFNLPVGFYFNRFVDPYTRNPGDTTFPEYVSIATYSMRFGAKAMKHQMPGPASDQPPTTSEPSSNPPGKRDE